MGNLQNWVGQIAMVLIVVTSKSAFGFKEVLCQFPYVLEKTPECVSYSRICSSISELIPGTPIPSQSCIDSMTVSCSGNQEYSGFLTVGLIPGHYIVLQGYRNLESSSPASITIEEKPVDETSKVHRATLIRADGELKDGGCEF